MTTMPLYDALHFIPPSHRVSAFENLNAAIHTDGKDYTPPSTAPTLRFTPPTQDILGMDAIVALNACLSPLLSLALADCYVSGTNTPHILIHAVAYPTSGFAARKRMPKVAEDAKPFVKARKAADMAPIITVAVPVPQQPADPAKTVEAWRVSATAAHENAPVLATPADHVIHRIFRERTIVDKLSTLKTSLQVHIGDLRLEPSFDLLDAPMPPNVNPLERQGLARNFLGDAILTEKDHFDMRYKLSAIIEQEGLPVLSAILRHTADLIDMAEAIPGDALEDIWAARFGPAEFSSIMRLGANPHRAVSNLRTKLGHRSSILSAHAIHYVRQHSLSEEHAAVLNGPASMWDVPVLEF